MSRMAGQEPEQPVPLPRESDRLSLHAARMSRGVDLQVSVTRAAEGVSDGPP